MAEERHVALQAAANRLDRAASFLGHLQEEEVQVSSVRQPADEFVCVITQMVARMFT